MNLALEIARQTMLQAQTSLGVATNNISNSKVDGYTRQEVNLTSNFSINSHGHLVGTGAVISSIDRVRTGFYDKQYRDNLNIYSHASATSTALGRIESIVGSLDGDTGLKTSITNFFNSLEELSKNPEKTGIKHIVKDNAVAMVSSFKLISNNLKTMKEQYQSYTSSMVTKINDTIKNLKIVNDEIGRLYHSGQNPNDLLDTRDRLIDNLSSYMDISVTYGDNNKLNILSNGHVLIHEGYASSLNFSINTNGSVSVKYEDGAEFKSTGGELSALMTTINSTIPKYNKNLDTLAQDFIDAFNNIHSKGIASNGTTNINFFEGTTAENIKVSEDILNNPDLIVTSSDGTKGDNSLVLNLIELLDSKSIDGGQYGIIEYLDNISSSISAEKNASSVKEANYKYIKDELYTMRSNEIGVNEDEELINSVRIQQTFAAASKIISTLNEMFSSLISAV